MGKKVKVYSEYEDCSVNLNGTNYHFENHVCEIDLDDLSELGGMSWFSQDPKAFGLNMKETKEKKKKENEEDDTKKIGLDMMVSTNKKTKKKDTKKKGKK